MNDEYKRLQDMLERATAPGDDMPADLNAETSSLREGWVALGKLLDDARCTAGKPLDNWQVALRSTEPRHRVGSETQPTTVAPRRTERRWSLTLVIAVAAMLLIAVSLAILYRLSDRSNPVEPHAPQLVQDDRAPAAPTPSPNPEPRTLNPDLAWDDSLDEQITTVAQAAVSVQEDWYARVGGFSAIQYGLEQIRKDIENETL